MDYGAGPSTRAYAHAAPSYAEWSPPDAGAQSASPDFDGDDASGDDGSPAAKRSKSSHPDGKMKRGAKACLACRKLKMRCVGADAGGPCTRCVKAGTPQACTFEPSQRGKRRNMKAEAMAKTVEKMEATLDTVLRSIQTSDPTLLAAAAGMIQGAQPTNARLVPPALVAPSPLLSAPTPLPAVPPAPPVVSSAIEMPQLQAWADQGPSVAPPSRPPSPRLHSLPDNSLNPLGLLAEASLTNARAKRKDGDVAVDPELLGIAHPRYFAPGAISILPLRRFVIEQRMAPALLTEHVVTPEEVVELFDIYFRYCSAQTCLLVEELYTPTNTGARSPFLFTCICAVAARYYTKKPALYAEISRRAHELATEVIIQGYKSVEVIQGFFLLALWSQPVQRYEQDRTWQFSGLALRLATDLNLFRKTNVVLPDSMDAATKTNYRREILNRERTWLYCWVVDRSMSTLLGKPATIQEDFIIRSAKTWYQQPEASPFDIGLCAMVEMHRLNGRIVDTLYSSTATSSGLNHDLNYRVLMRCFVREIHDWREDWASRRLTSPPRSEVHGLARDAMREFYFRYYSLVFLGCGLQHAVEIAEPSFDLPSAYSLCLQYATELVEIALRRLVPINGLTYMTDSNLLMLTYGATFLLKLTKPAFRHLVDEAQCVGLVEELVVALQAASVNQTVGPALYAAFLQALLHSRKGGAPTSFSNTRAGTPLRDDEVAGPTYAMPNGVLADPMMGATSAHPSPRLEGQPDGDPLSKFWHTLLLPPGLGGEQMPTMLSQDGNVSMFFPDGGLSATDFGYSLS